jgi:hypothetical protein
MALELGEKRSRRSWVTCSIRRIPPKRIGWEDRPFQYEVGIADLAVGVLGWLAFWGNFSFRLAAAIAGIVWQWGDALGHMRLMMVADNFAPGNARPWFWTDMLVPFVLGCCLSSFGNRSNSLTEISQPAH